MRISKVMGEYIKHGRNKQGHLCYFTKENRLIWDTSRCSEEAIRAALFIHGTRRIKDEG